MSERGSWPNGIKPRINIVLSRAGAFRTRWSALGWWLLDVTAAIAIVCLGSALGFPSKPKILEVTGFVLQFAGTIAVLQDLDSTIAEFGGRPLRSVVRSFFVDLYELVRTPRTISASMNIQLESVTLTGHAASMHVESNGTLEDRVANLERRMRRQKPTSLKPRKRLHEPMINSANELMRKLRQGKVRGSACLIE